MKKNIFKKCTSLVLTFLLIISICAPVYSADNSIKVQLNGENISFEVAPQIVNNRTLVPMRTIFEKLGANVEWDGQTRTITATQNETVIKLSLNSREALVTENGIQRKLQLDTTPIIVKGKTLVPIRFISESLGKQVGWDAANRTVIIIDYGYFLNALKTQAPNFFQFATNKYGVVNTGEFNSSGDVSFKYNSTVDSGENVAGNVNAVIKAKINEDNGSMDAVIKVTGLEELLSGSGLEDVDSFTFNFLFDNNSFYVKSNLFDILEQDGLLIGDKWIKADIADLNIPDVETLQDLKEMQSKQSTEQILDSLVNTPMQLDVNSFREAQAFFDAFVTLVDDNHFKVSNKGVMKVYTWNINKQDLIDAVLNMQKNAPSAKDMTLEDLAEIKKFTDTLVFDFEMVVEVKNNIIVNSEVSLNTQMDIPDEGHFELSLETNSEVLNPNNSHFEIELPDPSDVINLKEMYAQ